MLFRLGLLSACLISAVAGPAIPAQAVERFRNDKLVVNEVTLAPGVDDAFPGGENSVAIYLTPGRVEEWTTRGPHQDDVQPGVVTARTGEAGTVRNIGTAPLRLVHIVFLTSGSYRSWGLDGLPSSDRLITENHNARVYELRFSPHETQPEHTHRDGILVCLSGAEIEHTLPDGTVRPVTLHTGDILWRTGETHSGRNLSQTELRCIVVEPK